MALQSSGQISIVDIVGEFGGSAPHGLKEYYAAASGVPGSGEISIKDFYGKSSIVIKTASNNQTNRNLSSIFGGVWGQSTPKEYQVPNGVNIGGTGNAQTQAAIRVPTGMGGTLKIVIAGTVTGHGGDRGLEGQGASGFGQPQQGQDGTNGGHAIFIQSNGVTIQVKSTGKLRGGGGGGGGGGRNQLRSGGDGGNGGNGVGWQQSRQNGQAGQAGQSSAGRGGEGGNGGNYGQHGQDGQAGNRSGGQGGERGLGGDSRVHSSGKSSTLDNEGGQVQG